MRIAIAELLTTTPIGSAPPDRPAPSRSELWARRLMLIVEVIFFVELGMLLVVLPWTPLWTDNALLASHYSLRELLSAGWLRGAITGIGLINIWIGIWDAVHYSEK